MSNNYTKLYRPLRSKELEQIIASGMKRFPPRGFWQPIFYPVLDLRYAKEISEAWKVDDAHIVSFETPPHYLRKFPVQTIGESYRRELWVPAWQLEEFNDHIVDRIRLEKEPASNKEFQHSLHNVDRELV